MNPNKRRVVAADDAFDENGLLKDGHTARVPVHLRDGLPNPPVRRRALDAADREALASCRPGYRYPNLAHDSMRERRAWAADAYAEVEHRLQNAWRDSNGNTGFGSSGFRGQQEGDACTVRGQEYPDSFGSPGHLERRNGRLVCVPDDSDDSDPWREGIDPASDSAFALNQIHDATVKAYEAYRIALCNAWRRS
jgi:hypothetical protein